MITFDEIKTLAAQLNRADKLRLMDELAAQLGQELPLAAGSPAALLSGLPQWEGDDLAEVRALVGNPAQAERRR